MLFWGLAFVFLGAAGLACYMFLWPIAEIREALDEVAGEAPDGAGYDVRCQRGVGRLGGPESAAARLRFYLRLHERIAPRRSTARDVLEACGDPGVPVLCDQLRDDDPCVRAEASGALRRLHRPRSAPALVRALADRVTCWNAVVALGEIGDACAVDGLLSVLECPPTRERCRDFEPSLPVFSVAGGSPPEEDDVRRAAVRSLGQIGSPRALAPLALVLASDPDPATRKWAARALGRVGGPAAVTALTTALGDEDEDVRRAAATQLCLIDSPPPRALAVAVVLHAEEDEEVVWSAARRSGPEAAAELTKLLGHSEECVALRTVRALAKIRGERSLDALVLAARANSAEVRRAALLVLGTRGCDRAEDALVRALHDRDRRVRSAALWGLRTAGTTRCSSALIRMLKSPEPEARCGAIEVMRKTKPPGALESLRAALNDSELSVREQAVDALGDLGDLGAEAPLLAALNDRSSRVRAAAARTLGVLRSERAVNPLCAALGDEDVAVRAEAADALALIGDRRAVPALRRMLKCRNQFLQDTAWLALEKLLWRDTNQSP